MRSDFATTSSRVAIVLNGNAKQVTDELVGSLVELIDRGDLYVSHTLEEGADIADTIVSRGYHTVLTGGGDGTFVQMVTWMAQTADRTGLPLPRVGLLRLGTGNALAWVLGAQNPKGRGVVADIGRLHKDGGTRPLRLIEVADLLTPFAGLGLDANGLVHYNQTKNFFRKIAPLRPLSAGAFSYATAIVTQTIPQYLVKSHPRVIIRTQGEFVFNVTHDDKLHAQAVPKGTIIYDGPSSLVAMSTIPYWGFGAKAFPFADERQDCFQLRVADIGSFEAAVHIRSLWKGTYRTDSIQDFLVDHVSIHYEVPMPLQVGGDLAGKHQDIHARLSTRRVEVVDFYAPPSLT